MRKRPGATRRRSRSALPRLNTREHIRAEKRKRSTFKTLLLGVFQFLLVVILACTAFVSFATLADETWLPRFCEQTVIGDASDALSRFIDVDVCKTPLATHRALPDHASPTPTDLNEALAIIQQGQAVGDALEGLIASLHEISVFPEAKSRIDNSLLRVTTTSKFYNSHDTNQLIHTSMIMSAIRYGRFVQSDLGNVIVFAKYEYREVVRMIFATIDGAQRAGARRCLFFEHWFYDLPLVGRWSTPSIPASRLLAEVGKLNDVLMPQLGSLYRDSGRMMDDLAFLNTRLGFATEARQNDEAVFADIEQHMLDFSHLGGILDAVRGQSTELGSGLLGLPKMVKRHRCLGLSQEDGQALAGELAKLQASIDNVESGWAQRPQKQRPAAKGVNSLDAVAPAKVPQQSSESLTGEATAYGSCIAATSTHF